VLRYLGGTTGHGLRYTSSIDMIWQEYIDSDWGGSAIDKKSTFGCCFTLGSSMVSWCSRKQTYVALSIAEAEYIALSMLVREVVWLRKLLADLSEHVLDSAIIHYGNQSCVKISENLVFHDKLNHIEIKTWCRGRKYSCCTFLQMSRLLMFLPNRDEVQVLS
jgi:hypothetical protein